MFVVTVWRMTKRHSVNLLQQMFCDIFCVYCILQQSFAHVWCAIGVMRLLLPEAKLLLEHL